MVFYRGDARGVWQELIKVAAPARGVWAAAPALDRAPVKDGFHPPAQADGGFGFRAPNRIKHAQDVGLFDRSYIQPPDHRGGIGGEGVFPLGAVF